MPVGMAHRQDCSLRSAEFLEPLALVNYGRPAQPLSVLCKDFPISGQRNTGVFAAIANAPCGRNVALGSPEKDLKFYYRTLEHRSAETNISVQICAFDHVVAIIIFSAKPPVPTVLPTEIAHDVLRPCETSARFSSVPNFLLSVVTILEETPWPLYKKLNL
jgi:hypothetical protein